MACAPPDRYDSLLNTRSPPRDGLHRQVTQTISERGTPALPKLFQTLVDEYSKGWLRVSHSRCRLLLSNPV